MIDLFFYIIALSISLGVLWFAGDLSVLYSVKTAVKFKLKSLFIGFVLIAVSTGLPELSIVISSIFRGVEGISAGTILGSNVCDISLVLGLSVLFGGTIYVRGDDKVDSALMLLITSFAMFLVFMLGSLSRLLGVMLILFYFIAIWFLWQSSSKKEAEEEVKGQKVAMPDGDTFLKGKWGVLLKLIGSILLVLVSSELSVRFALELTKLLNLSLETVGATIFAIGTSLPEITVGLNAVRKKEYSLALGNSLGSVLEQGTLLLGLLATFSSKEINIVPLRSLVPFMFTSFFIVGFGIIGRKKITRIEGSLMLVVFVLFMIYQLVWIR